MLMRKIIFSCLLFLLLSATVIFGIYKATPLLLGPSVDIATPVDGQILEGNIAVLRGTVVRANALYINGVQVLYTEHGIFETRVPLYRGNNLIHVEVTDKYGRSKKTTLTVGTF